jgi:hypothetical protein
MLMRADLIAKSKRRPNRVFSMSFSLLETDEREKREDHRGDGDSVGFDEDAGAHMSPTQAHKTERQREKSGGRDLFHYSSDFFPPSNN